MICGTAIRSAFEFSFRSISEFHMRQRYGNEPLEIDRDREPNTLWTDEDYIGQKL